MNEWNIILLYFLCSIPLDVLGTNPIVKLIHGGQIKGQAISVDVDGKSVMVNQFLGIPYAKPPVGTRRFAEPEPHEGWVDTRETIVLPPACWHYILEGFDQNNPGARMWVNNTHMDEDCLYLNIWAPAKSNDNKPMPVMVWIYGGGFTSGTANLDVYNGSFLAATQNVIVVSMQYRLGAFGFLRLDPNQGVKIKSVSNQLALGNQGLLDQRLALIWVNQNIGYFNGDEKTVTIFGESAGSVSVSILWLSPITQKYFKRAIMESGSIYSRWGLSTPKEAHVRGEKFALACGCTSPSIDRHKSLDCLQSADPLTLVNQLDSISEYIGEERFETLDQCLKDGSQKFDTSDLPGLSTSTRLYFEVPLKPVIDGYLIPKDPDSIFDFRVGGYLKQAPELLIGTNKNEAMYFLMYGLAMKDTTFIYENGSVILPYSLELAGKRKPLTSGGQIADFFWVSSTQFVDLDLMKQGVAQLPAFFYGLGTKSISSPGYVDPETMQMTGAELMQRLDQLVGDLDFVCPTLNFADRVSRLPQAKVYLYRFDKRTENFTMPEWLGVMHGYEIEYVFGMPRSSTFNKNFYGFNQKEKEVSDKMMKMWTNFARFGDPNRNIDGTKMSPEWPLYKRSDGPDSSQYDHLIIDDVFSLGGKMRQDGCRFWLHEIPELSRVVKPTCKRLLNGANLVHPISRWYFVIVFLLKPLSNVMIH